VDADVLMTILIFPQGRFDKLRAEACLFQSTICELSRNYTQRVDTREIAVMRCQRGSVDRQRSLLERRPPA